MSASTNPSSNPSSARRPLAADRLHDAVLDVWFEGYRSSTVDELLVRPRDATAFCQLVRRRLGVSVLPDPQILRVLLGLRKRKALAARDRESRRQRPSRRERITVQPKRRKGATCHA